MLLRTHIAIGLAVALFFLPHVNNKWIFFPIVLLSSILPDADSRFSTLGRKKVFRPLQMVSRHRGILHTYTFCIFISVLLAFYYPALALPFFLGYSFHLYADLFTPEGIMPFWPLKKRVTGHVTT